MADPRRIDVVWVQGSGLAYDIGFRDRKLVQLLRAIRADERAASTGSWLIREGPSPSTVHRLRPPDTCERSGPWLGARRTVSTAEPGPAAAGANGRSAKLPQFVGLADAAVECAERLVADLTVADLGAENLDWAIESEEDPPES